MHTISLVLLIGCSKGASGDTSTNGSTPVSSGSTTPSGCVLGAGVPGSDVQMTTTWDGIDREWVLHLPADYDCTPRPVILGIHGYYGSGRGFENDTARMFDHLDANGIIGIFPDGLAAGDSGYLGTVTSFNDLTTRFDDGPDGATCTPTAYDYPAYPNCGASEETRACRWGTSCADDAGLFRALIAEVSQGWTVDADRIYMTGFSQGGQTVQGVACELADVLAAIAPQHGFAANGHTCGPTTKLPLFQVWGRNDTIVDGRDQPSGDGMIYDGGSETALVWAEAQGCDTATVAYETVSDGKRGWQCLEHPNCATDAEIVNCSWDGGHSWGTNPTDGNFALDAMWAFFEKHRR